MLSNDLIQHKELFLYMVYGNYEHGFEMSFTYKNNFKVDLFSFYYEVLEKDGALTPVLRNALWLGDIYRKMAYPYTDFIHVKMEGEVVLAPRMVRKAFNSS